MISIAYFISPHGYGHAARASAVMEAIQCLEPDCRFEIFTTVTPTFFAESLPGKFGYHDLLTDIGLVQKNSLVEDLPETARRLDQFLPFKGVERLAQKINRLNCRLVLCDIAPLGLAVARAANLPGVLIENFTWDWIYEGYDDEGLKKHLPYLRSIFQTATYHIQTEPVCDRRPVDLTVGPISRSIRLPAEQIRAELELPEQAQMVLITMGGVSWEYTFLEQLKTYENIYFVISGAGPDMAAQPNLIPLPSPSQFFYPDLVNAADLVIGKVGYSTLAEVNQAGVPFGYITRQKFREAQYLVDYAQTHMQGEAISPAQFESGQWLSTLPDLLALPRYEPQQPNGAEAAARFILGQTSH